MSLSVCVISCRLVELKEKKEVLQKTDGHKLTRSKCLLFVLSRWCTHTDWIQSRSSICLQEFIYSKIGKTCQIMLSFSFTDRQTEKCILDPKIDWKCQELLHYFFPGYSLQYSARSTKEKERERENVHYWRKVHCDVTVCVFCWHDSRTILLSAATTLFFATGCCRAVALWHCALLLFSEEKRGIGLMMISRCIKKIGVRNWSVSRGAAVAVV